MSEYEGWKNRATWNVALWINNEYGIYLGAVNFMKDYQGKKPYKDFIQDCGLAGQRTPDQIAWAGKDLDYKALNDMMWELRPNDWKSK
jgi:hypothetical protein